MADLLTLTELKTYLGVTVTTDDTLLTQLLNDVEALFESATLRPPGSYTAGDERTEVLSGTGTQNLWLAYPIAEDGLLSVSIGYTTSAESLDLSNIVYGEGSRVITRIDGGVFGTVGQPRYVTVVYEHQGNLPEDAKLAIKSVVASIYRNRGSEGMRSETVGSFYSYTRDDIASATASDPFWQTAVENNRPVVIG
jgi:hypothetical protein